MDLLNTVMQWIVAPVAAVVYMIYNKQQEHHTDIAELDRIEEALRDIK
jgi:hypothetical protein